MYGKYPLVGKRPLPITRVLAVNGVSDKLAKETARKLRAAIKEYLAKHPAAIKGGLTLWKKDTRNRSRALFYWGPIGMSESFEKFLRKVTEKYGFCISRVISPSASAWRTHTLDDPGPYHLS
jgi:hypothetical protein